LSRNLKNRALEKNKSTEKISFCHDAWMYFSLPGMTTMLSKVLEIERRQLADYARVDYAITKGEDEIAALEELRLGDKLRRKTSVVRDRTVLAVREVRKNMAKRAVAAKNMRGSLVESLRQRSRFAVADTVDASLRARCFASLACIPTLTLLCHFIDAIKASDFARAESVRFEFHTREDRHEYVVTSRTIFAQFAPPSDPADILKRIAKICRAAEMADARVVDLFRRCDPIHRVEPTDHGPDRSRALNTSLLGAHPAPPREHAWRGLAALTLALPLPSKELEHNTLSAPQEAA